MKKAFYISTIFFLVLSLSCAKVSNTNPLLGNDLINGKIAATTSNMQTMYGTFASSSSIEGNFTLNADIKSFTVNNFDVKQKPTTLFFASTTMDAGLDEKYVTWLGKPMELKLNGVIIPNLPVLPYANVVDLSNFQDWNISKSIGLTLTWKIRSLVYTPDLISRNMRVAPGELAIPKQPETSKTIVGIVPDDLQHTTGTSQYWEVGNGLSSFKIPASALTMYAANETVTIVVGSGTESNFNYNNTKPVNSLFINSTALPYLTITP